MQRLWDTVGRGFRQIPSVCCWADGSVYVYFERGVRDLPDEVLGTTTCMRIGDSPARNWVH